MDETLGRGIDIFTSTLSMTTILSFLSQGLMLAREVHDMPLQIKKFQQNFSALSVYTIFGVQPLAEDLEMKSLTFLSTLQVIYKVYLHFFTNSVVRMGGIVYKY